MYNSNTPSSSEIPSSRKLLGSTFAAIIVAAILLITAVLPAEYGIDPTGIGRVLWLTEMGEVKMRLAAEATADANATSTPQVVPVAPLATASNTVVVASSATLASAAVETAPKKDESGSPWRDETSLKLAPGQGAEIKLKMKSGEKARYAWSVDGGVVNHDTHGEGLGRSVSYAKGRDMPGHQGELIAAFTGEHGWFWRNRGQSDVKLVLKTGGVYQEIRRIK